LEYWLNVDKPTKKCVLHIRGCVFEVDKQESKRKGVGKTKKDGGWLVFSSKKLETTFSKIGLYVDTNFQKDADV